MVEYILGNYLVKSGKISKEQLDVVLKKQDTAKVRLGIIAVSEGMMTLEEADKVNRLQSVKDMRFGDIAVEQGYLTDEQVGTLLKKQGNTYLMFVQTLIDEKLVTMEDMEALLEEFRKENSYGNAEMEDLKSDDVSRIVSLLLPEEAKEYQELVGTMVRTVIRLIDRSVYIDKAEVVAEFPTEGQVSQELVGDICLVDCLAEKNGALLRVGSVYGREIFDELNADALDAAGEFLNCVNGLYASGLSREGQLVELLPPEYAVASSRKKPIYRVPIFIGEKGLYFLVG
ncbi:MAG: hypothetical protein E7291_04170 [Lachnospiraceae bacterium]|nr:hypothetical protein [Lachnospiraceae bacterium]